MTILVQYIYHERVNILEYNYTQALHEFTYCYAQFVSDCQVVDNFSFL